MHTDPKELDKWVFKERLEEIDPIKGDIHVNPAPLLECDKVDPYVPGWLTLNQEKKLMGAGKYVDYYRFDERPPTHRAHEKRAPSHKKLADWKKKVVK